MVKPQQVPTKLGMDVKVHEVALLVASRLAQVRDRRQWFPRSEKRVSPSGALQYTVYYFLVGMNKILSSFKCIQPAHIWVCTRTTFLDPCATTGPCYTHMGPSQRHVSYIGIHEPPAETRWAVTLTKTGSRTCHHVGISRSKAEGACQYNSTCRAYITSFLPIRLNATAW